MSARFVVGVAAALLVTVAGLSCGRDGAGVQPGTLRVEVTIPAANSGQDGAVLFTLTGPAAPTAVSPAAGLQIFYDALAPSAHYAVTGTLTSGTTIATISVPDVRQPYTATIQQVAGATYALRGSLVGYSLSVVP